MTLRLLEPLYQWQTWPRYYEPSNDELASMSEEEYELWREEEERFAEYVKLRSAGRSIWRTYGLAEKIHPCVSRHPSGCR